MPRAAPAWMAPKRVSYGTAMAGLCRMIDLIGPNSGFHAGCPRPNPEVKDSQGISFAINGISWQSCKFTDSREKGRCLSWTRWTAW